MQIQKVQSNQQTFGTKVILTKELNKMLTKRGYGYSLPFKDCIHFIENNGTNDTMTVFFEKEKDHRHYVKAMRSYINELGQMFVSKDCVKRPFLKNNHVASLSEIYYYLKKIPMQEIK